MLTYYDLLGVTPEANEAEIKARYRELARALHPDLQEGDLSGEGGGSRGLMAELNEAYRVLSDPEERAAYERQRRSATVSSLAGLSEVPIESPLEDLKIHIKQPQPWIMRGLMLTLLIGVVILLVVNFRRPNQRDFNREFGSAKTLLKPQVDRAMRGDLPSLSEGLESPQGVLLQQMSQGTLNIDACLEAFPHQLRRVDDR